VTGNGQRRPPRPRIEIVHGPASEAETAAIAAALQQFLAETAAAAESAPASRWQQAALREGVARDPGRQGWGLR
jgi:hypothetical protein